MNDKRIEIFVKNEKSGSVEDFQLCKSFEDVSDGYHTFKELYDYRMIYNALWFNDMDENLLKEYDVHKSWCHHDGEKCFGGGWFIVMAELPTGQISNHYEAKYWDMFNIPEKEKSNEWDGHTPQQAYERMIKYIAK
jgi:hypothetical protein